MQRKNYRIHNGPAPAPARTAQRFWSMAEVSEDEAEITMYGEVVDHHPTDWWTGEQMPGLYISPEGFLEDLEQVRGKSRITIRINSIGGDLYTGMAIYTQLKSLTAHKTVIIDGIAASAASVIAMAGDDIRIPVGGTVMIHEAAVFLYSSYDSHALKDVAKVLEAANKSAAEVYAEKTGLEVDAVRSMMSKTKWMVGQEAVDNGFATELLEGEGPTMCLSADRRTLMVGGLSFSADKLPGLPATVPVQREQAKPAARAYTPPVQNITANKGGNHTMDPILEINTIEALREQYPRLVLDIENAAVLKGVQDERTRLSQIDEVAPMMDATLVREAKYGEKPCSAQELTFRAYQQQMQLGAQHLQGAAADYQASGAGQVGAAPNGGEDNPKASMEAGVQATLALHNQIRNGGK